MNWGLLFKWNQAIDIRHSLLIVYMTKKAQSSSGFDVAVSVYVSSGTLRECL